MDEKSFTVVGEHAKPGEALLRVCDSALSSHNAHQISSFAKLISFCRDVGKIFSSSDAGNLTNLRSLRIRFLASKSIDYRFPVVSLSN